MLESDPEGRAGLGAPGAPGALGVPHKVGRRPAD